MVPENSSTFLNEEFYNPHLKSQNNLKQTASMKFSACLLLILVILQASFLIQFSEAKPVSIKPILYKCTYKERHVKFCPKIYKPVSAHNTHIFCIRAPCPQYQSYLNRCLACKNKYVDYFYYGKCHSLYSLFRSD